jgi:superfamily I DNA/RNA helicase/very-short-patch-repair endonuclease
MNEMPGFSPRQHPEGRRFDFFFDRLDTCLRKGRGFSLFQADTGCVSEFAEECERRGLAPLSVPLSALEEGLARLPGTAPFVVVIQDVSFPEFIEMASQVADRLIFPLWFRRIPICFFSWLDREAYVAQPIRGEDIHRNVPGVVRVLLAEQALTLLERSNYQIHSPAQLELQAPTIQFTPAEEKIRSALEAHQIPFEPQVRLGRQVVDFLVELQNKKVVVECESRVHPGLNGQKDQGTTLAGYPLCRLSAAEIGADPEKCIRMVQQAIHYRTLSAYAIDNDLDPSQQQAIALVSGPIRVLAPAGSGKTKTLVNRILHLLNQGIAADRILALAFNKKARDEMQDRLERRGVKEVEVRTFHSFGYEIVREGLGWTFSSSQKKTAKALMKAAIQEHTELPALRNQDPLEAFLGGLRQAKMELPPLSTVTVEYGDKIYPLEPIFYSYLKKQASAAFVDFDDMIYLAVRLLLENQALRRKYQSRFAFVLVDEFQDLNEAQLLMLQIIGLPENNIFAVGDDDQMIYGFRGADVKHIVEFEKRFPVATTHVLNTNYRSSRMIVRHANWLIRNNRDRVSKDIQPRKDAQPGRFELAGGVSLLEQARQAAAWLADHKKQNNLNWRDYAVLYRYNAYEYPLALMLDAFGIPHTPVATGQLFKSSVGMDVYSYLQVLLFPQEAKASDFERILKRPNKFLTNQLIAQARDWTSFEALPSLPGLRNWERQKLTDFIGLVEHSSRLARGEEDTQTTWAAGQAREDGSQVAGMLSQSQDNRSPTGKAATQLSGDASPSQSDGSQSRRDKSQAHWAAASPPRENLSQPQGNTSLSRRDTAPAREAGSQSAADCLQTLKADFGLAEFYREQSRIADDLDQASSEGLLDVMIALAGNHKTPLTFYQFLCKSIADQEADPEKETGNGSPDREEAANWVQLSTIHKVKGREFRNVVYFNLSQNTGDPKQAAFVEEERRVAYVAATRPTDDLLITFSTTKPSEFLREIALNPQYSEVEEDDLQRSISSTGLRLERANVVLEQLEARKQKQIAGFRELKKTNTGKHSTWLQGLLNQVQLWRIDRALARIEGTEGQIKAHREATIAVLERELRAMEEEARMRVALLGRDLIADLVPPTKEAMNTAWKEATKQGDLARVRSLLEKGMEINAKDEHGQTALMNAAHAGQVELVRLLIGQGADLNVTSKYNLSALMLALIARRTEAARLLIEAGADVNIRSTRNFSGITALSLAEQDGQDEIASLLKQKGALP